MYEYLKLWVNGLFKFFWAELKNYFNILMKNWLLETSSNHHDQFKRRFNLKKSFQLQYREKQLNFFNSAVSFAAMMCQLSCNGHYLKVAFQNKKNYSLFCYSQLYVIIFFKCVCLFVQLDSPPNFPAKNAGCWKIRQICESGVCVPN